ncbi:MAG: hypothetical protein WA021_00885 [Minisyncoccia bacterium]
MADDEAQVDEEGLPEVDGADDDTEVEADGTGLDEFGGLIDE